jgi:hypothetical protein
MTGLPLYAVTRARVTAIIYRPVRTRQPSDQRPIVGRAAGQRRNQADAPEGFEQWLKMQREISDGVALAGPFGRASPAIPTASPKARDTGQR